MRLPLVSRRRLRAVVDFWLAQDRECIERCDQLRNERDDWKRRYKSTLRRWSQEVDAYQRQRSRVDELERAILREHRRSPDGCCTTCAHERTNGHVGTFMMWPCPTAQAAITDDPESGGVFPPSGVEHGEQPEPLAPPDPRGGLR